jgi:ABC-type bacteriocin/lantibiotic exporter with double-glycine peptidase domain
MAVNQTLGYAAPVLVLLGTFSVFVLAGGTPTVARVFTVFALMNMVRLPLFVIPMAISRYVEACVALRRLDDFFNNDELQYLARTPPIVTPLLAAAAASAQLPAVAETSPKDANGANGLAIELENADFAWAPPDEDSEVHGDGDAVTPATGAAAAAGTAAAEGSATTDPGAGARQQVTLKNVTLRVPHGKLVAVVGSVGSCKSSLLSAMLGEMHQIRGNPPNICPRGATRSAVGGAGYAQLDGGGVAYVAQEAWIQNESLRGCILFGSAMEWGRYNKVLDAAQLRPDLAMLPAGDLTEVSQRLLGYLQPTNPDPYTDCVYCH